METEEVHGIYQRGRSKFKKRIKRSEKKPSRIKEFVLTVKKDRRPKTGFVVYSVSRTKNSQLNLAPRVLTDNFMQIFLKGKVVDVEYVI